MAKYEIMLIIDPKEDFKIVESLAKEVFDKPEIIKLDRTELAYEINKSKTAHYALVNVEATGDQVKELTRKVNISKTIWRLLSINLDTEIGRDKAIEKLALHKEKLTRDRDERSRYADNRQNRVREYRPAQTRPASEAVVKPTAKVEVKETPKEEGK